MEAGLGNAKDWGYYCIDYRVVGNEKNEKNEKMKNLKPKQFIQSVLINEVGEMIEKHPYISFIIMGIGIEFMGKCLDKDEPDWNRSGRSGVNFKNAIKTIPSLQKYEPYLQSHDLYSSFRCGLAHAVSPKFKITLSSKEEAAHLLEHSNGRLNLKVEEFYKDFKEACEHLINKDYEIGDKMNSEFLEIPDEFNDGGIIPTSGSTISFGV